MEKLPATRAAAQRLGLVTLFIRSIKGKIARKITPSSQKLSMKDFMADSRCNMP